MRSHKLYRDQNPRIGDIMVQAAPFLRMYALYIENNAKAVETIQVWKDRSKEFADIIKRIESSTECSNTANPTLEVGVGVKLVYSMRRCNSLVIWKWAPLTRCTLRRRQSYSNKLQNNFFFHKVSLARRQRRTFF